MLRVRRCRRGERFAGDDEGSASLEFISAGMLLLLPVVYLVVTLSQLEAGAFAVEAASRHAARVFVQAPSVSAAKARAATAVEFALADYGQDSNDVTIAVTCSPRPSHCLTRHGLVTVTVTTWVSLPLVPPILDLDVALSVPVTSTATQQVSRFWGAG
jgi:Flp pilus assembly protein TadG